MMISCSNNILQSDKSVLVAPPYQYRYKLLTARLLDLLYFDINADVCLWLSVQVRLGVVNCNYTHYCKSRRKRSYMESDIYYRSTSTH